MLELTKISGVVSEASEMAHGDMGCHSESTVFESLVEDAMVGDSGALQSLCEMLGDSVMFRVKYMLGSKMNMMDAEDVSQEVLMRMCRNISDLKNPRAFNGWLSSIITNEANRYAKNEVDNRGVYSIDDFSDDVLESNIDFIPDAYIENKEFRKILMEIILKLPIRQRRTVIYYYYAELSVTEIAMLMNITHQGVSQNLARARENIKVELIKQPFMASSARQLFCKLMAEGVEPLRFFQK